MDAQRGAGRPVAPAPRIAGTRPAGPVTIPVVVQPAPVGGDGTRAGASPWRGPLTWLAVLVAVGLVAVGVRTWVLEAFSIPSGSMLPTLQIGDRIAVDKLAYDFHPVHRGDVIVFHAPAADPGGPADLVKRVIGLPGETVSVEDGGVVVDGRPLTEPWLPTPRPPTEPGPLSGASSLAHPYRVPAGSYFVMGDNRTDSEDSRWFGPVPRSAIVGEVVGTVWPWSTGAWLVVLSATAVVLAGLLVAVLAGILPRGARRPG